MSEFVKISDELLGVFEKDKDSFEKYVQILKGFIEGYLHTIQENGKDPDAHIYLLKQLIQEVKKQIIHPYNFEPFHRQVSHPFDYFTFGKEFLRPLIHFEKSELKGLAQLSKVNDQIKANENVILLANHQIEADPQVLFLMLENHFPSLAKNMIFIAGERVITDPLAIPFSLGCNLLCIYSKKYIDNPIEDKPKKIQHNHKTMQLMSELLKEGGKCIYVAPSGGRDRPGPSGKVEVSHFDPQSIELFYLMAKKAKVSTHFYPLALATYSVLPPPDSKQIELGEMRITKGGAVFLDFGDKIDMDHFEGHSSNRLEHRKNRGKYIHDLVAKAYAKFPIDY